VSLQCRRWWDKKCDRTRPELSQEEIVAIIAQFEEVRERWLEKSASAPLHRLPTASPLLGRISKPGGRTAQATMSGF
jgi:hypothetical protein